MRDMDMHHVCTHVRLATLALILALIATSHNIEFVCVVCMDDEHTSLNLVINI